MTTMTTSEPFNQKVGQQFNTNVGSAPSGKEAVLKKLLETQETYIQELEAKCKSMADQLTESPFKQNSKQSFLSETGRLLDITSMSKQKKSFIDRLNQIIQHYEMQGSEPMLQNLCQALTITKQDAQIELEVFQQRDHQHQSLIKQMQFKFSKERQDFIAQFEQTETHLQQKVLQLEQDMAVLKRQLKRTNEEDLNAEVLQELETLEARYKQSDDELRAENQQLRKQLAQQVKQSREIQSQLITTKQQLDVKNFEQFTQLKRLEETLRQIRQEVKQSFRVVESHIQGYKDCEISFQSGVDHKTDQLANYDIQKELDSAQQEIDILRKSDMSEIWQSKAEILEKEKKVLADELQKLAKTFSLRETALIRDLKFAQQQLKLIQSQQSKKDNLLKDDVTKARQQLEKILAEFGNLQIAIPQVQDMQEITLLHAQIEHLKSHNLTLRAQLNEALIASGRCATPIAAGQLIDRGLLQGTAIHKLQVKATNTHQKIDQVVVRIERLASEIIIAPTKNNNQIQYNDGGQVAELTQAKKSLMLYINKCNQLEELLDTDLQLDSSQVKLVLVKKFAIEIQSLKQELQDCQQSSNEIVNQQKKQIEQLQDKLKSGGQAREIDQAKVELRSLMNEFRQLISQIQTQQNEVQSKLTQKPKQVQIIIKKEDETWQLRNQVESLYEQYTQVIQQKENQFQSIQQVLQSLQVREKQLANVIEVAKQIVQSVAPSDSISQDAEIVYQRQIEFLRNDLDKCESRVKQEYEQTIFILSQKLQLLEQQKDLLLKEVEQEGPKKSVLALENERLKKHILSRQQETAELRLKTSQLHKQLKQKSVEMEQEFIKKYKDRMSGHLKVFDLELSKLQSIINL